MRRRVGVCVLLLATGAAIAEPSAEQLFDEGQREYDAGHYAAAVARWQAAYDASKLPLIVLNLAQAYRLGGDCPNALAAYRRYVVLEPPSEDTEETRLANGFIRELEPQCGPSSRPAPVIKQPVAPASEQSGRGLKIAGLVIGGTGVVMLVGGLVLGKHASTLGDRVTTACAMSCDWTTQKDVDAAGRRDASIGYALDVVGAVAIVGGAVMYYLGVRSSQITVLPRSREGGAVVSWSGSW